jgi:hypothetical protein
MNNILRLLIVLTLFLSCNSKSSTDSIKNELTKEELEYLQKRDEYIDRLQRIQNRKSATGNSDSLYKAERRAMSELEGKLKVILKDSRFSDKGKINLETLLGYLGFGLLDGLSFDKDSLQIFYTSKNLFFKYFQITDDQFDRLSPAVFENVFQSAYQFDAHLTNFSFVRLHSTDNVKAYGMVAELAQITGRFTPQFIYVLVSIGDFVYIAQKELKEPIKEIPRCISVWDSIVSKHSQPVDDDVFEKYCNCYRKDLINDSQFPAILRQLQSMASYLQEGN